jgi:hypothetical protein
MHNELVDRAFAVFRPDATGFPAMTLRGGSAVDSYAVPMAWDADTDQPSDAYLATYAYWGLPHLDPASWRHYLPYLIDYALRHTGEPGSLVTEGLLSSLRPPDREPPRLASISAEQEAIVVALLDVLAFDEGSAYRDFAMQVLEEYWVVGAMYRQRPAGDA